MHASALVDMPSTTITISKDAYKALKAEKKEGESFSDVILRKFGRGSPSAIRRYFLERDANPDLANAIEEASHELRKNCRTRKVEL
jgi:predicted CopG family antitoxin